MRILGPEVDSDFRAAPEAITLRGHYVTLEPASMLHRVALWRAMEAVEASKFADSFAYLSYGPFASQEAFDHWWGGFSAREDHVVYVVCPEGGAPCGWLTLMDIQPRNASIELGNIWLSPALQRTRAATESFFLIISYVFANLYYRRLSWKCNALNVPSRRAALRMGFSAEGILRNHMIVKGRARDTIYFSVIEDEYPSLARSLRVWLGAENFDTDGQQVQTLEQIRALAQAPA